jgi:hypothetical protein
MQSSEKTAIFIINIQSKTYENQSIFLILRHIFRWRDAVQGFETI